jgi:hypothetical protein
MIVLQIYNMMAVPGIFLILYVAFKSESDPSCSEDARGLRWARRAAFIVTDLALCITVIFKMAPCSMALLVGTALLILAVNAVVLSRRQQYPPGYRAARNPIPHAGVFNIAERARARRPF